jgi:hypothetical protein
MSYGGNGKVISTPPTRSAPVRRTGAVSASTKQNGSSGEPDFTKMTAAEKIAYHKARWDRILG